MSTRVSASDSDLAGRPASQVPRRVGRTVSGPSSRITRKSRAWKHHDSEFKSWPRTTWSHRRSPPRSYAGTLELQGRTEFGIGTSARGVGRGRQLPPAPGLVLAKAGRGSGASPGEDELALWCRAASLCKAQAARYIAERRTRPIWTPLACLKNARDNRSSVTPVTRAATSNARRFGVVFIASAPTSATPQQSWHA